MKLTNDVTIESNIQQIFAFGEFQWGVKAHTNVGSLVRQSKKDPHFYDIPKLIPIKNV